MDTHELGSIRDIQQITGHASNAIPVTRGIMVEAAGDVAMRLVDSNADVILTLLPGVVYPFRVKYVRLTGTTVTVFGLYN
jgi:hypothetical protein